MPFINYLNNQVLRALSEARDSIGVGAGRGKPIPYPEGLLPRQYCAAWVAVAWQEVNGCAVKPNANQPQEVCEALWIAAGGRKRNGDVASWRSALATATAQRHASRLEIVRRDFLSTHERLQIIPPWES